MKNYQTFTTISNTDGNVFNNQVSQAVKLIESKGWNAEVKFSTAVHPNGLVVYSAMIISGEL